MGRGSSPCTLCVNGPATSTEMKRETTITKGAQMHIENLNLSKGVSFLFFKTSASLLV